MTRHIIPLALATAGTPFTNKHLEAPGSVITDEQSAREPASELEFQSRFLEKRQIDTKRICKRAGFLEKTWNEFSKESGSWKKTDRNFEKSQLLLKEVRFLEKRPNEFAKELASWKKHGTNSQKSQVPGKKLTGILKRVRFF